LAAPLSGLPFEHVRDFVYSRVTAKAELLHDHLY
jgi:hypothetical protein